jgi:tetratricopeptide (TPR) repeat protein
MDLIQTFFQEHRIQGELIHRKWVDFSHNRNEVLHHAFQKTDYLLMFDADDSFVGTFKLPPTMTEDAYLLTFGEGMTYPRPALITNRKEWKYEGVLHETLEHPGSEKRLGCPIEGKYHIVSGRTGNRNKNPRKYQDDAELLERTIMTEQNPVLKHRYMYYCAQSYRDCQDVQNAIRMYTVFLDSDGNPPEKYLACMELAKLYLGKNQFETVQMYFCKTVQYEPERIEGIVMLMEKLFEQKNHVIINALYHRFKGYNRKQSHKTFFIADLYDYVMEAYNSVSASVVGDPVSGYECCKKVIMYSKNKNNVDTCTKNLMYYKTFLDKDPAFKAYLETKMT